MNQKPPFTTFDASAGSGKTFQLVVQYLSLCLGQAKPDFYQKVLAITFTNKAAAEMKERILSTLDRMANGERGGEITFIENNTQLSEGNLRARAIAMRTDILHNYHSFSISTIDYFTHKVIRTFAQDLNLPHAFEIELDVDLMRLEAIDNVLGKVGKNKELTKTLLTYVREQLQNDKSWKVERPLLEISSVITKENSLAPLSELKEKELSAFLTTQKSLSKQQALWKAEIMAIGKEGLEIIKNIPAVAFFSGNSGGVPKTFAYWSEANLKTVSERTLKFAEGKQTSSKADATEKTQIESLSPQIIRVIEKGVDWLEKNRAAYYLYEEAQKNIFGLALINEISNAWEELKVEQQKLPISDFNQLLNEQIKDQPTPYIYERLGEKYKHFFIDEFQDTSFLQFTNLLPLINNALSESGSCLLVGDAKQSIYSWRGGDANLFMQLAKKEPHQKITFSNGHSLLAASQSLRLEENYRSKSEIVDFNNQLFEFIGNQLEDPLHSDLYTKAPQKPTRGPGGYVDLQVRVGDYDPEEILQEVSAEIKRLVTDLQAYNHRDVCLLFRTNSEARTAVEHLISCEIPVVSGDALFVHSSPAVKWALVFLKLFSRGIEKESVWEFFVAYTETFSVSPKNRHALFHEYIHLDQDDFWRHFQKLHSDFSPNLWRGKTLFSLLESALDALGLLEKEDGYIQSFLDLALDYTRKKEGSVTGFLGWWDEVGHKKTVALPEDSNAVQVLTLHKSKGLQFPVVFLPKLKWSLMRNPEEWIPTEFEDLGNLDFYFSLASEKSKLIGGEYLESYKKAHKQAVFDNINTLYVGLTRACDRLYAFTFVPKNQKSKSLTEKPSVGGFLHAFVEDKGAGDSLVMGAVNPVQKAPSDKPSEPRKSWNVSHNLDSLKLSSSAPDGWTEGKTSPRYWGSLVHRMLQEGKTIEGAIAKGELLPKEAVEIQKIIQSLKAHPLVGKYFTPSIRVMDERDLLLPNNGILRPDRMVFTEDQKIVVIDYKTGEVKKAHQQQLNQYADALLQAGFTVDSKVLIYLSTHVEEVISW